VVLQLYELDKLHVDVLQDEHTVHEQEIVVVFLNELHVMGHEHEQILNDLYVKILS
jgi:hypothetical protein